MNFSEFRGWFDDRFSQLLEQKTREFAAISKSQDVSTIASYIQVIAQKGKRFRPFLVYCASGVDDPHAREKYFLLFASVELLHVFALIHDDIMDRADTRHDVVCAHRKFIEQYGELTAEAIGILLGDSVFAWAYECLFEYMQTVPELRMRIREEYTKLVREVMHGQLLDILSPTQPPLSAEAIIEKMTLKTARYSFVRPMRIGFVLRGDVEQDHQFAEEFGLSLGLGFQLQDDLLDGVSSVQSGKTRFVDIASKQQTLITWYMSHEASPEAQKDFLAFLGKKDMSVDEQQGLSALLESSGALAYVRAQSAYYFANAARVIESRRREDSLVWENILAHVQGRTK